MQWIDLHHFLDNKWTWTTEKTRWNIRFPLCSTVQAGLKLSRQWDIIFLLRCSSLKHITMTITKLRKHIVVIAFVHVASDWAQRLQFLRLSTGMFQKC